MKAKKIAAISSAIIFGVSAALAGMPTITLAQEQTVTEETTATGGQKAEAQEPSTVPEIQEKPQTQEPTTTPETQEKPQTQEPTTTPEAQEKPQTQKPTTTPEAQEKPQTQEPITTPEAQKKPQAQEPATTPETQEKPTGISIDEKNFPDAAFRKYIENKIDKENNSKGILTQAEINSVTSMMLSGLDISDTKGIEYFTELQTLSIYNSNLSSFSLKGLKKLTKLSITSNKKLTTLNLSDLPNLEILDCYSNHLSSIDVSNFKKLREIDYHGNLELTTLDFRGCDSLEVGYHSVSRETVYISAGMTKYVGCNLVSYHTGNMVIDLDGFYTVNPDGSKSVDLSKVISPALIKVLANENHDSFNKDTNILTIPAGDKQTILQAGKDNNNKPTHWTFYTEITAVNDCTVKFDTMGGSIVEDQIIANGKTATEPSAPTKDGYLFKGWYLDKEFSNPYDFTTPVTKDITLYALWEKEAAANTPPTITANDITLTVGDTFNPLDYATASDKEDGEIKLTNDNVIKNDVNTAKAGTYHVTYKVTDKNGASTEKAITITVNPKPAKINTPPVIDAKDITLTVGDKFNPLDKVTATDKEDGKLKLTKDNVIKNNVDTSKAGTYSVTYKVTDKDGASVEKTIKVTVKDKKDSKKAAPKTADMANLGLLSSMFAGSAGVLSLSLRKKRRKNDN